ncbi:hypothetical protein [Autumnicola lenta]|uniref:DinB/UmuC family translesion DNA polymerase n=1 Tax=Autumnicola lenta TaxID=3075593 RepID=UPI003D77AEE3
MSLEATAIKKDFAVTIAFESMYSDYAGLKERVSIYAIKIGEKLRRQDSNCYLLQIFLLTNPFKNDLKQYRESISVYTPFQLTRALH